MGDSLVNLPVDDLLDLLQQAMPAGEMVFVDRFSLLDSMSALEIGDPRMDSGVQT